MKKDKKTNNQINPLFKFLSKKWANELVLNGSFRLSKIQEFRDNLKYANHIHDSLEGILHIENEYDFYEGYIKNANGLLLNYLNPLDHITAKGLKLEHEINIYNALVYCTTSNFLSNSLHQAFEDGKDSCVLITKPELFFNAISDTIKDFNFASVGKCIYEGKSLFENNPGINSKTNSLLMNPLLSIYFKPKEYKNQMEVRAVWTPMHNNSVKSIIGKLKDLTKYCILINYDSVDKNKILNYSKGQKIGTRIIFKNKSVSSFQIELPYQVCSPIVEEMDGEERLNFILKEDKGHILDYSTIDGCHFYMNPPNSKIVPALGNLNDIEIIEYFTVD
jgi:hypothetical protein